MRNTANNHPLENLMTASEPGGIERQEKQGQTEFVNSELLPVEINSGNKATLEKYGVVFGEPLKDDPLFCEALLPDGWGKKTTDHSMWSELYDDKGIKRASIFYKAAFYDRKAHLDIV